MELRFSYFKYALTASTFDLWWVLHFLLYLQFIYDLIHIRMFTFLLLGKYHTLNLSIKSLRCETKIWLTSTYHSYSLYNFSDLFWASSTRLQSALKKNQRLISAWGGNHVRGLSYRGYSPFTSSCIPLGINKSYKKGMNFTKLSYKFIRRYH